MRFMKCLLDIDFIYNDEHKVSVWKAGKIYLISAYVDGVYYVESEMPEGSYGISEDGLDGYFTFFECNHKLQKECNFCKYLKRNGNLVQCDFNGKSERRDENG